MQRGAGSVLLGVALMLGSLMAAHGQVTAERITYHGWPDAVRLANKTVELVFVPQIGRIMRYGYLDGSNVLWENPALRGKTPDTLPPTTDWINFGGDKLWNAPQSRSGWPPDPTLDRAAQKVEITPDKHLRVTGQGSAKSGIRFTREIVLAPKGTGVTLKNTLTNTGGQAVAWSVWEVTQVDDQEHTQMPLYKGELFSKGYYVFKDSDPAPECLRLTDSEITLLRNHGKFAKIGTASPAGWLAAEKDGVRFQVSAPYPAAAEKDYPDDGCAQEIYTNPDPDKYIELELLSPVLTHGPGKSYTFTTHWKLTRKKTREK